MRFAPLRTGHLVDAFGITSTDVHRWVDLGILRPLDPMRGTGFRYEFEDVVTPRVVETLVRWRHATAGGVIEPIGRTAAWQLAERPDLDVVAVDLGESVVVTIGLGDDR